jgi:phage terminase large subunit-like protein
MSYGKDQFDYGAKVERGAKVDETYFYAAYAAPQDLSDDELAKDPLRYAKMANPAWNHTIDPVEILADYNTSKESATGLIEFKVYRLNIWATAAKTWLRPTEWNACRESYTEQDLAGQRCFGGFDLAKILDFTALTLVFPVDKDLYRQLVYFWLPEQTARERAELVDYLGWEKAGHIKLTPGNVADYETIENDVAALAKKFQIVELAFDPHNAEASTQRISQLCGVKRYEFTQSMATYTEATKEYERLVKIGGMRHNGHPVLAWQAGHVLVKTDWKGQIMPIKQQHGDIRTIDGVVGGIMGLDRAMKASPPAKGSLFIC